MKPKIVIVEDGEDFAAAIISALEKAGKYKFEIVHINPSTIQPAPSFEELQGLISEKLGTFGILLLDNMLSWKWKGAHMAPSFEDQLISISTDLQRWADKNFIDKHKLRSFWQFQEGEDGYRIAIAELNGYIDELLLKLFEPDWIESFEVNEVQ